MEWLFKLGRIISYPLKLIVESAVESSLNNGGKKIVENIVLRANEKQTKEVNRRIDKIYEILLKVKTK